MNVFNNLERLAEAAAKDMQKVKEMRQSKALVKLHKKYPQLAPDHKIEIVLKGRAGDILRYFKNLTLIDLSLLELTITALGTNAEDIIDLQWHKYNANQDPASWSRHIYINGQVFLANGNSDDNCLLIWRQPTGDVQLYPTTEQT